MPGPCAQDMNLLHAVDAGVLVLHLGHHLRQSAHHPRGRRRAILLGADRFMSEARASTNLIGKGMATSVVSIREGALGMDTFRLSSLAQARPPGTRTRKSSMAE